jgi:DUF2950 family protein
MTRAQWPSDFQWRHVARLALLTAALTPLVSCGSCYSRHAERVFATAEDAVRALIDAAKAGNVERLLNIFGSDAKELIASADVDTARLNREIFVVAAAEHWELADAGADRKTLVIGRESWPFPVPLVKDADGWRFDTAAGKEEVIARRIGRNELAVIQACRTYVTAQRLYARTGHDDQPAGLYAATIRSGPGLHNGLYWPVVRNEKRSPLGELIAEAAGDNTSFDRAGPALTPFHGYYFKILTAQGSNAPGGAKDYIVNGQLSDGFALIAWPAEYDVTGVMTFLVNHSGTVYSKDLGPETASAARAITTYDPDGSWKSEN